MARSKPPTNDTNSNDSFARVMPVYTNCRLSTGELTGSNIATCLNSEPCDLDKVGDSLAECIVQISEGANVYDYLGEPEYNDWRT